MKLYEISNDLVAVQDLFNSAQDENGEPRELTPEEDAYLKECLTFSADQFEAKFDGMCKLMANLRMQSDEADGERKTQKAEMDRLSNRAKAFLNQRDSMKKWLQFNMKVIGMEKYKSSLFSAGIQSTQLSITPTGSLKDIPEDFLKPRELNTSAIKAAIKDGKVKVIDGDLFYNGEQLTGVHAEKGETLVIR